MTAPRQILSGTTYLVTRRCAQRQFLLKPSPEVEQLFLYLLAVASARYGVAVHAVCVLSNHFHMVVTDRKAKLPAFEQYVNSFLARALNASYRRSEAFWGPSSYSAVSLEDAEAIVDKTAYTLANPVAAGLVRYGKEWPGIRTEVDELGLARFEVARPERFFRPDGNMPPRATLQLEVPEGFESRRSYVEAVRSAVEGIEDAVRRAFDRNKRKFMGAAKVLAQRVTAKPRLGPAERKPNPRFATRNRVKRRAAFARLRTFLAAYRQAWLKLQDGVTDALFPMGTYWLRVAYGQPAPDP